MGVLRGLYTAASGMLAELRKTEVIANNIANVDTPGFKRDEVALESFPAMLLARVGDGGSDGVGGSAPVVGAMGTGVQAAGSYPDLTGAPLRLTGVPLDVGLDGPGFLVVRTPQGEVYTRRGDLVLTPGGVLVTAEGYPVLDVNRDELKLEGGLPVIGPDGTVLVGESQAGQLAVVEFENPAELEKLGQSMFAATAGSGAARAATRTAVRQGFLEASNANPVREMVDLIAVFRAYEAAQRAVQALDQALGRAANDLGRA